MKELDLSGIHERLIDMAYMIDKICARHKIPLYMISGTMLGAIRHQGFIPWDDDMDFAVPFEHYFNLIDILNRELPKKYKCLTFNDSKTYLTSWIKIEDTETIFNDRYLDVSFEDMPGLTIDIFPLTSCNKQSSLRIMKRIHHLMQMVNIIIVLKNIKNKWMVVFKQSIKQFLSFCAKCMLRKINKLMKEIQPGAHYIIPTDPNYHYKYFPMEWFHPETKYKFIDNDFTGVTNYDCYLTELYKDYMKLPPADKRRVHSRNVFLK